MITNQEIESYFYCKLKAQYYYEKQLDFNLHPISILYNEISQSIKKNILEKLEKENLFIKEKLDLKKITIDNKFSVNKIEIKIPFIENTQNQITPIFISPYYKISIEQKNIFSFKTQNLVKRINQPINYYKIVLPNLNLKKFKNLKHVSEINIESQLNEKIEISKKQHCNVCEFKRKCNNVLAEKNDLRLFSGIREPEVLKWNEKGYFTITQLSYKFRPRKRKISVNSVGRFKFELKALAIRERKTFIASIPTITPSSIELYVDFESIPDENYIYLIGVIVVENNKIQKNLSFWASSKEFEEKIFLGFFKFLKGLNQFTLFHYGNYEIKQLKIFNKKSSEKYNEIILRILSNSINILKFFHTDVYPPTYSNSLKEISNYLNFYWSDKNSSGLNSIVWRKRWELNNDNTYKNKLIKYNIEDCSALFRVKRWLLRLKKDENNILTTDQIVNKSNLKFGDGNFQISSFKQINKTAYFNYQRTNIYIRTEKEIKSSNKKKRRKNKIIPNKIIYSKRPENCPNCNFNSILIHAKFNRLFLDIKFTKNGFKRWVILLNGNRFKCPKCNYVFPDLEYHRKPRVGIYLRIWIIYNYMSYGTSYKDLPKILKETFNIEITRSFVSRMKGYFANLLIEEYRNIIKNIIDGNLIHIDETTVKVKNHKGYVWVITNMTQVYYFYRENRECNFLNKLLENFKGVLISDFYTGYDSLKCVQQKCLIHLMRDINDLLFKNQNNLEIASIAQTFGEVLRKITKTIDKFGLKKRNLNKHKKEIEIFFKNLLKQDYNTTLALKLQKRLIKNKNKLFAFLDYDGIPWNNNNAEHVIKSFALYRKKVNGSYNENGLKDYLVMLSIMKTCHYQNKSFLSFLKNYDYQNTT